MKHRRRSLIRRNQICFLVLIAFWLTKAQAEEHTGVPKTAVSETPVLDEYCEEVCLPSRNTICKNSTCVCQPGFPVHIRQAGACLKASLLGTECEDDLQCQYYDQNAICQRLSRDYVSCTCIENYIMRNIEGLQPPKVCFPGPAIVHKDIPTFLGFGLALSIMSALLCLVLKIFSRGRFARTRSYGNAAIPPPLTVSDLTSEDKETETFLSLVPVSMLTERRDTTHLSTGTPRTPRIRFSSLPDSRTSNNRQETYAAFALAAASNGRSSPKMSRNNERGSVRSGSSSRRTSYTSLSQQTGDLKHLSSSNSFSYNRPTSRRLSAASARSLRSPSGFAIPAKSPDRDHYILYMVRAPTPSLKSDTPASTTGGSITPQTSKSPEQILTVYHAVSETVTPTDLEIPPTIGSSRASSSFRIISTDDVFQEEEEDEEQQVELKDSEKSKNERKSKGQTSEEKKESELSFSSIQIHIENRPMEHSGKNLKKSSREVGNELNIIGKTSGAKTSS